MSEVVNVEVVVTENGEWVQTLNIPYFIGQPYEVQIVTPDGVDIRYGGVTAKRDSLSPMGSAA